MESVYKVRLQRNCGLSYKEAVVAVSFKFMHRGKGWPRGSDAPTGDWR